MTIMNSKRACQVILLVTAYLLTAFNVQAEVAVPSNWEGEIVGRVFDKVFRLPISIEIRKPLPFEKNPFHLFIGAGNPQDIGHLFLASAVRFNTRRGTATLRYLTIFLQGSQVQARLTQTHHGEAAKVNGFSGPNVSAGQASPLMRGVLRNAWGATEMFGFGRGAVLTLSFQGNRLSGSVQGAGNSYTGTSSSVVYRGKLAARRTR